MPWRKELNRSINQTHITTFPMTFLLLLLNPVLHILLFMTIFVMFYILFLFSFFGMCFFLVCKFMKQGLCLLIFLQLLILACNIYFLVVILLKSYEKLIHSKVYWIWIKNANNYPICKLSFIGTVNSKITRMIISSVFGQIACHLYQEA